MISDFFSLHFRIAMSTSNARWEHDGHVHMAENSEEGGRALERGPSTQQCPLKD